MTATDRFNAIVEQGLCIGCGLCEAVAGRDTIEMSLTENLDERPVVTGQLEDDVVDTIYAVCPGTRVAGMPDRLVADDTRVDNVWGPWRRMVRGWAGDPEVRHAGATGGVLTALALYLIRSKRVDFILHATAGGNDPAFGQFQISHTESDVMAAAGSRYGPTAVLRRIDEVLATGKSFAFVGKPCDIAALRNFATIDPRVDELVQYWLTPVCGGFCPPASTRAFYERIGVEAKDVVGLRYRGEGCPGPTTVTTTDGVHKVHYLDYWGEDESQWQLPFRCKICPDGIGESADIAAADSWPGGSPDRVGSETDPGTNAMVVRTVAGEALLDAVVADGALVCEYDIAPDEMSYYQPHQMRKKYAAWPRLQGLRDEGRIVPDVTGLRIRELSEEMPAAHGEYQRNGTRQRVQEGRVSEPTPRKLVR